MRQERMVHVARATARLREKIEAKAYEGRLIDFANYVWPVVEPNIPFIRGWAIDGIAEHLEAVTRGDIKRLLINVPPGFSKSLLTNVFWPAWEWGPQSRPWYRYVCAAYSNHLTERDNMRCRNIVMSPQYQRLWKDRFKISNDQFTKVKFANDKTGWKLATSVGGIGVGERGDRFVIDDANNTMMMESEAIRFNTNMWLTEVVPSRLNSPSDSAIVIIQQRLHEEDVSGVVLAKELGYTHMMVPMEYDSNRHCVTVLGLDAKGEEIFWDDPRGLDDKGECLLIPDGDRWVPRDKEAAEEVDKREGMLAWPERFTQKVVDDLKVSTSEYAWAGQYQQTPEPRGGSIFKYEYWQDWKSNEFPDFEYVLASIDTAYTEKEENDPSAMTIWGLFRDEYGNPKVMLMYAWQERMDFPQLVQRVIDTCSKDSRDVRDKNGNPIGRFNVDRLLIESKASGMSVYQTLRQIVGFNGKFGIQLINPTKKEGDKVARAHSVVHLFSEHMIYAPLQRKWADMVVKQGAVFPRGSHDDLVDSMTMGLKYLRDGGFALRREEHEFQIEQEKMFRPKRIALYPA